MHPKSPSSLTDPLIGTSYPVNTRGAALQGVKVVIPRSCTRSDARRPVQHQRIDLVRPRQISEQERAGCTHSPLNQPAELSLSSPRSSSRRDVSPVQSVWYDDAMSGTASTNPKNPKDTKITVAGDHSGVTTSYSSSRRYSPCSPSRQVSRTTCLCTTPSVKICTLIGTYRQHVTLRKESLHSFAVVFPANSSMVNSATASSPILDCDVVTKFPSSSSMRIRCIRGCRGRMRRTIPCTGHELSSDCSSCEELEQERINGRKTKGCNIFRHLHSANSILLQAPTRFIHRSCW